MPSAESMMYVQRLGCLCPHDLSMDDRSMLYVVLFTDDDATPTRGAA